MDKEQKQKVLLGVLVVLILGAGSVWYATRDPGPSQQQTGERVVKERKQREASAEKEVVRKERQTAEEETGEVAERKTRERPDVERKERKSRAPTKKKDAKKKKESAPAA